MDNTLRPCPFCGGVGTLWSVTQCESVYAVCQDCGTRTIDYKYAATAIAAWNRRADHLPDATKKVSNAPLTLDELRQMDGEPVWTVGVGANRNKSHWCLVMTWRKSVYTVVGDEMVQVGAFCQYGETWLAYRSKPKEERNEAD